MNQRGRSWVCIVFQRHPSQAQRPLKYAQKGGKRENERTQHTNPLLTPCYLLAWTFIDCFQRLQHILKLNIRIIQRFLPPTLQSHPNHLPSSIPLFHILPILDRESGALELLMFGSMRPGAWPRVEFAAMEESWRRWLWEGGMGVGAC